MRVDVHAHYYPAALYDLLERVTGAPRNRPTGFVRGFSHHVSVEGLLELMDGAGIDRMVMSLGNTPPYYDDPEHAAAIARGCNDLYVDLHSRHPNHFNTFVGVPLPHVDAALAELDRALALPGVVGVGLGCSVLGKPLDHADFDPFFAELDRRGAVLFLHPVGAGAGPGTADYGLTWMVGAPFEDTVAALRLVMSGLTARYPRVRVIVPHLGGTLPFLLQRLDDSADRQRATGEPVLIEGQPSTYVRRLWFDTVNSHPAALRCACESFGADRLLLGTDYPYLAGPKFEYCVRYVEESGLPPADVAAILGNNAQALLGLTPRGT